MRRGVLIFALVIASILLFAVHQVWTLISLLFHTGSPDAITYAELPSINSTAPPSKEDHLIPKIIHQTYIDENIPPVWQDAQKSCIDMHPASEGWEYKLWTDAKMLEFIRMEYPEFAETFEGYTYPIQRADSIRYFVLYHFGGIYIDLDDGCNRSLEPLLDYPSWVRKTVPTGISNDAMGAAPGNPFFKRVTEVLEDYDRNWLLPYITVMGSTGPLFLSVIWRHWTTAGMNEGAGKVRILFPNEYQGKSWSFFTHHLGNSWHGADVELIFWMARNWLLVTIIGFTLGGALIFCIWFSYRRILLKQAGSPDVPRWKIESIKSRFPFWQRTSARKEYELVSRHEV